MRITFKKIKQSLQEKTYTVGDTQYWRRMGKCYSWTSAGGRKEISEEEYLKAISNGSPESTPVQKSVYKGDDRWKTLPKIDRKTAEDNELLRRAQMGDEKSSEEMIKRYDNLVYNIVNKKFLPGTKVDKEDLHQVGSIGLYNAIVSFDPNVNDDFFGYASGLIEKSVIDEIRSANTNRENFYNQAVSMQTPVASKDGEDSEIGDTIASRDMSVEDQLQDKEDMARLTNFIQKRFSNKEQQVLAAYLQKKRGNSYNEIAEELGMTPKAVSNTMVRIRDKLKDYLEDPDRDLDESISVAMLISLMRKNRLYESFMNQSGTTKVRFKLVETKKQELDERTYYVGDTQYWRRGGKCYSWTSTGGRKECSEEEYLKAISGGSGDKPKTEPPKSSEPPKSKTTAEEDYNTKTTSWQLGLHKEDSFEKDMNFLKSCKPGVTAKLKYATGDIVYARKIGDNKWETDSGNYILSDNDVVTVAHDEGKVSLNRYIPDTSSDSSRDRKVKSEEKDLGDLVQVYKDGTKEYEKPGQEMPEEEAKKWYRMMDDVIKAVAAESLGVSKYDLDYDPETGLITKWNDTDPSTNGFTKPQKEYYQTEIYASKVTSVKPDGSIHTRFRDEQYQFNLVGSKF